MRWLVVLVLLGASPVRAEMVIVSDDPAPIGRGLQVTISAVGVASYIHGFQAGWFGADLDLGWRRGRFELYGTGELAMLQFFPTSRGSGLTTRLGGGVRWYARGGRGDLAAMIIQLGGGVEGHAWDDQDLVRPDVDLGIGYDIIGDADGWRMRTMAHLIGFVDDNRDDFACRGCVTSSTALDVALGLTMGIAW